MKQKTLLLIVAAIAIILFVLPAVYSLFAGQHTFRTNVGCLRCHIDVADQLEAERTDVYDAHRRAANNTDYLTYLSVGGIEYDEADAIIYTNYDGDGIGGNDIWTWNSTYNEWQRDSDGKLLLVSIDEDHNDYISIDEMCFLCHKATLFGISATHTNTTARGCDDDRCHGNARHRYNHPDLFPNASSSVVHAGYLLSRDNIHVPFYASASNESSSHMDGSPFGQPGGNVAPDGQHISKGFWTCLGCHSHVEVSPISVSTDHYLHSNPDAPKKRYT